MLILEECVTVDAVGYVEWAPHSGRSRGLSTTGSAGRGRQVVAVGDDDLEEFDEDDFDDDFDDDFEDEDDDLGFDDDEEEDEFDKKKK